MNEYEYRIPLFGPNYLNSRIVQIIRPNTCTWFAVMVIEMSSLSYRVKRAFGKVVVVQGR